MTGLASELTGLPNKALLTLQPGTVVRVETAGGGGYGDPAARLEVARCYDVRNERL